MTNSETIEKLNEALTQLIDAYEILQNKNNDLENEISVKNDRISDMENKLSELNGDTEVQSNKMDGMLNRIQSLLTPATTGAFEDKSTASEKVNDEDIFNLDLSKEDKKDGGDVESTNKIDLGRMESLLNGLNTK